MGQAASLSVQIGPIVGQADGPLAMIALLFVVAIYVVGPLAATELIRWITKRPE